MKTGMPFTALRAFEAVVRAQGFARAAEELGVTQSAVSQHVKLLEDWLGARLVIRTPGRAKPTKDGQALADAIVSGFGQVEVACKKIQESASPDMAIGLSSFPGFAYLWLIPRLLYFDQKFPNFQVSVLASHAPSEYSETAGLLGITYGARAPKGFLVEDLISERLFPVCSPKLLQDNPIKTVDDLAKHTLLIDDLQNTDGNPPTWDYWAQTLGWTMPSPARELTFSQSNMVIQAAIQGMGVALGREPLVIDALADGRLVRPFPEMVASDYAYRLIYKRADAKSERLGILKNWLLSEAANQPEITDASLM